MMEDYNGTAGQGDYKSIYYDWIAEMSRLDQQRIAMMLYDNYRERFGMLKTNAAHEVASFFGISEKTVRTWRKPFSKDPEGFGVENRGKHLRYQAIVDEEYKDRVLESVRAHNNVTGRKNMTAGEFCSWLNTEFLPDVRKHHPNAPFEINERTAIRWLHMLGFEPISSKKGVYIDGHKRSDVVEYQKLYLRRLEIISQSHAPQQFCDDDVADGALGPHRKDTVLLFHDECIFIQTMTRAGCGVRRESSQ